MSMAKYECAVDHFANQMDLSLDGMSILEALNAGGGAIDLLYALRYSTWTDMESLIAVIDNLLEEWN